MAMTTLPIHPDSMNSPTIPGAMPGVAATASANMFRPPKYKIQNSRFKIQKERLIYS
jgi:hypothetical protein